MYKKIVTIVITATCLLLTAIVVIGYLIKEGIISNNNWVYNDNSTVNTNELVEDNSDPNISKKVGYPLFRALLKEGSTCTLQYTTPKHDIDSYGDVIVCLNNISISKTKGDFDICDDWFEKKDLYGTITNEYSYVVCDVSIINKGQYTLITTLNNLYLWFGVNDGYTEARSYNSKKEYMAKDYFYVAMEPNREYNYKIAYIVEDDLINQYESDFLLFSGFNDVHSNTYIPVIEN